MDDYSELTGDTPALVRGGILNLADLGGPAPELSTGLILTWRGRLVFGLDPRAIPLGLRDGAKVGAFTGIGGHLDPGELWTQAVVREAREEASIPVSLDDSAVTYLCREGQAPCPIAFHWDEPYRPLLVWVATFQLRRGPNHERTPVTMVNAVFRAAALGQPAPTAEIAGLLLVDTDTLLYTYVAPRPLGEILARGAQIVGPALPPETLLAPGGSAYFYAQWLEWQERTNA